MLHSSMFSKTPSMFKIDLCEDIPTHVCIMCEISEGMKSRIFLPLKLSALWNLAVHAYL